MAMRKNQPNVQAIDLWVSGMMNSASFKPGEKRVISGAGTCDSTGTAMASARNPAITASMASKGNGTTCAEALPLILAEDSTALVHLPVGKYAGRSRTQGAL